MFLTGFRIFSACVIEPFDNPKQGCPNHGVPDSVMRPEAIFMHSKLTLQFRKLGLFIMMFTSAAREPALSIGCDPLPKNVGCF